MKRNVGANKIKLNGWKRIGIVASIVWIASAGLCTLSALSDADLKRDAFYYNECATTRDEMNHDARVRCANGDATAAFGDCLNIYEQQHPDVCSAQMQEKIPREVSNERAGAAFVAFVPVPFFWGFAYLILFLVRWIKRGFQQM